MDYYAIAPCPKCGLDCWRKMGGHHKIPVYYQCTGCSTDTNHIRAQAEAAARSEGGKA